MLQVPIIIIIMNQTGKAIIEKYLLNSILIWDKMPLLNVFTAVLIDKQSAQTADEKERLFEYNNTKLDPVFRKTLIYNVNDTENKMT